ncbi:MAG: hypothetical protein HKN12_05265, partial [Gemmatimonadetes bacterium]|nr:hypothetical protein [Gemmatimonadota bacterium]
MLAFLRTFVACIFAILFLVFVPLFLMVVVALFQDTGPRDDSWLTIGLDGELLEYYGPPTLREIVDAPPPSLTEVLE